VNDATGMPQTAVVIGGTSEIARAVLRDLIARRLRRIVLVGRDVEAMEVAAKELGALGAEEVGVERSDVTEVTGHADLARRCVERLGTIDLVLVAAGVLGDAAHDGRDAEAAAAVLTATGTGPAAVMVAFAEVLRHQGQGTIAVLSSVAGVRVRKANFVYGAAKAALDGFAQGLADSLEGTGVRVVIVRPGWVATKMTAGLSPGPMATTPEAVAGDVVSGLEKGKAVVWSPAALGLVFPILRLLPRALWRKMPG
jgi:decaprenylphospho-beta-D-erythro-pentofuranosid-2-ulose 2-reductase